MERGLAMVDTAQAGRPTWLRPLTAALAAALLLPPLVACQHPAAKEPAVVAPRRISALGRVEPESKIRRVSIASSVSGDRIEKLLVQEDDEVKKGQPLAILNSYGSLQAALREADEKVAVSRAKLNQVLAGAKQGEIRAQEYEIESLRRELAAAKSTGDQSVASARAKAEEARIESLRYDKLYLSGAVSELDRDRYRTRAKTSQADLSKAIEDQSGTESRLRSNIEGAKQTLDKIKEVRQVDVDTAKNELRQAEASRDKAKQDLADATVLAPQEGRILKIFSWPGDKVGDNGLLEMADTSAMVITAEVYQSDLNKLKIGQGATITADGFQGSARATLYKVLPQVQKQSIFAGTPGQNMDQRVYEVKLRLHPTAKEEKRWRFASNLQVNVVFDPTPAEGRLP
ncbi:MAG: biotin/lipoyl-binding protein [Cyanobacteria bacterium K_Offshore_surface_m2_239]|nr:biotin/lipoyl-binding protein [Cyanobacteria bacterium K_Offshore_surface_m2_239]